MYLLLRHKSGLLVAVWRPEGYRANPWDRIVAASHDRDAINSAMRLLGLP